MFSTFRVPTAAMVAAGIAACAMAGCTETRDPSPSDAAPARVAKIAPAVTPAPKRSTRHNSRTWRASTPTSAPTVFMACDANISVKRATTTCPFAENVFYEYWLAGGGDVRAYSPAAEAVFRVRCEDGSTIVCSGGDGAEIHIDPGAVAVYDQAQANEYAASHDLGPLTEDGDEPSRRANGFSSARDTGSGPGENIPNYENGTGYRVQCEDGTYSHSGGRPGACSWHGGVAG